MKNMVLLLALSLNASLLHADPRESRRPVHIGRVVEGNFEVSSSPEMLMQLNDNANLGRSASQERNAGRDCDQTLAEREPSNPYFMEHDVHLLY